MYRIAKRGDIYWIFGRIDGQRLDRSLKTKVRKEAEDIAKHIAGEASKRKYGIPTTKKIRLGDFMVRYLEYCTANNKPSTVSGKRFDVQFILAYFGDIPLVNITPEAIEAFKSERRSKVAAATINNDLATFKHALNLAVTWGYLDRSPAGKVRKYAVKNERTRYLTKAEAESLIKECPVELKPVVITALYTGMRRGEILGLDWQNVDLERKQITIIDSKNNDSRVVPLNDLLYTVLSAIEPKDGFVFRSRSGGRFKSVRKGFISAVKRAGIKDFTFHDLRHTFASWLAMKGVPLNTIGILLGHRTLTMTRRYSHLAPDYLTKVVELLTQN